jgi:hypothetical protein
MVGTLAQQAEPHHEAEFAVPATALLNDVPGRNPVRIIVDSKLRTPLDSRLVATARETPTCVITTVDAPEGIAPAAPRRIGESPYLEHPTQLLLRQVTLAQVFSFLHALSDGGSPLEARSIRLSAAREDPTGTQWTVELTLSYKLYSPIPAKAGGRSGT